MIKKTWFFIFSFITFLNVNGQDSIVITEPRFIIGLSGAPNHSYVIHSFADNKNGSNENYESQKICLGAEGKLFIGLQNRKIQATLGFGYAYYLYKYMDTYGVNKDHIHNRDFRHKFYIGSLNVNWLVGEKNCWMVGLSAEYGVLHYFKKFVHIDNPILVKDYSVEYITPQQIFWAGMNFGRLFKINKLIDFSIVFNTKLSSTISGRRPEGSSNLDNIGIPDGNLFVKTLNFNLSFKL